VTPLSIIWNVLLVGDVLFGIWLFMTAIGRCLSAFSENEEMMG